MKFREQTTDSSTDFKTNFLKFTAFTKNTLAKRVGGWMNGPRSTIGIYGFHELKLQSFLKMKTKI